MRAECGRSASGGAKVLRRLFHLRPATLVVEDVVEWERPVVTHQYWQSHGEWRKEAEGWMAAVGKVELCVSVFPEQGHDAAAARYAIDGKHRPVYRLDVAAPVSATARIITVLRARALAESPWPCSIEYNATADRLRLNAGENGVHTITWTGHGAVLGKE